MVLHGGDRSATVRSLDHACPGGWAGSPTRSFARLKISPSSPVRLTGLQWTICAIAALGFAFDIYEILVLPLVIRPAILELANARPGTPDYSHWAGLLFWLPAMAGGLF